MPHRRDEWDPAICCSAHDDFFVKAPQILQRSSTTGDDQQIRARQAQTRIKRVKAADRSRHLRSTFLSLHGYRPQQHASWEPVAQSMKNIADYGTLWRGDNPNGFGQIRDRLLACRIEQAFCCQRLLALLQHCHQCAYTGWGKPLHNQLILGLPAKGRDAPRGHHLHAFFRHRLKLCGRPFPGDRRYDSSVIFQIKINMAGARYQDPADLTFDPNMRERALQCALYRSRDFRDRKFWRISLRNFVIQKIIHGRAPHAFATPYFSVVTIHRGNPHAWYRRIRPSSDQRPTRFGR